MKKTFPTLYSRTSTGAIQQWTIFVEGDEYYTEHGQQNGKIVRSAPTVALPTNEGRANHRNANEQAEFEAQASWDKKQKSGGYSMNVKDIDTQKFVEPMLAKKFKDRQKKVTYPVISQCKYNGGRCVATKDGLFTRKGEKYLSVPHIENSLKEFFEKNPEAILDGELMGDGFKTCLNETMKLIRKTVKITPQDLVDSEKLVKYHIYDCYDCFNIKQSDGYLVRNSAIDYVVEGNSYCRKVESTICQNEEDVFDHFDKLTSDNEEG